MRQGIKLNEDYEKIADIGLFLLLDGGGFLCQDGKGY